MIKLLLILLFPVLLMGQTKTLFLNTGNADHDSAVINAYKLGYGNEYNYSIAEGNLTQAVFDTAITRGCKIIVYSTTGASSVVELANANYPNVILFMPSGSNSHVLSFSGDIPNGIILTGAGVDSNCTSYKIEFYDIDIIDSLNHSSYSNGYIAGKFAKCMDTRKTNIINTRNYLRQGEYSLKNGYGKITNNFIKNSKILVK